MSTRSRSFRPAPEATADARRFVRASLRSKPEALVDDAVLLADELITNAVRHSATRDPIDVSITLADTHVRVEVSDAGRGFDPEELTRRATVASKREGGWGLELVASLASRWGVETAARRTVVWFEIDRSASEA